jgi:hypothetical protein
MINTMRDVHWSSLSHNIIEKTVWKLKHREGGFCSLCFFRLSIVYSMILWLHKWNPFSGTYTVFLMPIYQRDLYYFKEITILSLEKVTSKFKYLGPTVTFQFADLSKL